MQRYIVSSSAIREDGTVWLYGDDFHHLSRVVRLREGEEVVVSSDGASSVCRIAALERDGARLEAVRTCGGSEPGLSVTWLQGLPKGDKIDLVIRHACEIGVRALWVFAAQRSVVSLAPAKLDSRLARWRKMAKEGSELAQRDRSLEVRYFSDLATALSALAAEGETAGVTEGEAARAARRPVDGRAEGSEDGTGGVPGRAARGPLLVPYEAQDAGLPGARAVFSRLAREEIGSASFVIGPEGGFAPEEISLLGAAGGRLFTLGPRVFRTETAGLVTAAALFYEWGELEGSR